VDAVHACLARNGAGDSIQPSRAYYRRDLGQAVVLKARAYPHISFRGKVVSIAPIATKQEEWRGGRTVLVTTRLDNDALLLKPEMSGNAKIYCGERRLMDLVTRRIVRYVRVEFWSSW